MSMPLRFLLHTDAICELMRAPSGAVSQRIAEVGEDTICTSIIVAAELRFGAAKSANAALTERVELILAAIDTLPFESPADQQYAEIRHTLNQKGLVIGPNDLLIAAHAKSLDLVVVTANEREFRQVPELEVENWLVPVPAKGRKR